ncbi:hypothetical protein BT96DRAFT_1005527 [Gymnopus androsaceus JB14]|uniref:Uncharacterized protein n=1 Tax=Gymnopus androsaceus JB14 TaxID=1447944 RepID=A0A6A4GPB7_9AGAR|nr:hypothetical protein BT96DRAFT_1005527 [Gymnopus androsaceus JB14]
MPFIEPIDLYVEAHPLPSSTCDVHEQTFPASSGPSRTPRSPEEQVHTQCLLIKLCVVTELDPAPPHPTPTPLSLLMMLSSRSIRTLRPEEESDDSVTKTPRASTSHSRLFATLDIPLLLMAVLVGLTKPTQPAHKEVRFSEPKPQQSRGAPVIDDDDDLIPKPAGEVGHPGRGGYNLANVLKWSNTQYRSGHVDDHLECEKPMKNQSLSQVKKVREATLTKYPTLAEYKDLWVIDDFVRNRLKSRKAALRLQKLEKIAREAEQAEGG